MYLKMSDCLRFFLLFSFLFFAFCFTHLRCFCRAVIHSFIHLLIDLYILFCVYTHVVHSFNLCSDSLHIHYQSSGKMSLILIALLQLSLLFRNVISTCSTTSNVEFTFYGYPDGPSDTTSFGCSGSTQVADGTAGGTLRSLSTPQVFHIFSYSVH